MLIQSEKPVVGALHKSGGADSQKLSVTTKFKVKRVSLTMLIGIIIQHSDWRFLMHILMLTFNLNTKIELVTAQLELSN